MILSGQVQLITRQTLANRIVADAPRWTREPWKSWANEIIALGHNPDPCAVEAIIGAHHCDPQCDMCERWRPTLVDFKGLAEVCEECLCSAMDLLQKAS
jgi:hypothetical protein